MDEVYTIMGVSENTYAKRDQRTLHLMPVTWRPG